MNLYLVTYGNDDSGIAQFVVLTTDCDSAIATAKAQVIEDLGYWPDSMDRGNIAVRELPTGVAHQVA